MILVFGQSGQVARELAKCEPAACFLSRADADLTKPEDCAEKILSAAPQAVINAAAYTAVDRAEEEEELATLINGAAPGAMAKACAELGIPLVHISTDYVFDGEGNSPFAPKARTAPLGAYGRSKLAGEVSVRSSGATHVILRTSWVFSSHGANFVKTMLRLSREREELRVVADQVGGPTPASAIAEACLAITEKLLVDPAPGGTYHFAGEPDVSWSEFAREIFRQANRPTSVIDIPSSDFPTPARRPANCRLDCTALSTFGLDQPQWKAGLAEVLAELEVQ